MTPRPYTPRAELRDVTLRDGLQLTGEDAAHRTQGRDHPRAAGAGRAGTRDRLDGTAGSRSAAGRHARRDRGADAEELERCWIWVATPRHIEKAAAAGARNFQYCFSASDSHNKANIGRSTEDSVAAMPDAVRIAQEVGGAIQLCIATAFTCPFEGLTDPERVIGIAADPRTTGADDIVVCDTIGQAIPTQVTDLIARPESANPPASHRLSRTRHLGPRRGEHPRRDRRRSHDGRRFAWRPRWLPVRARRQRQHLQRGPVVRYPPGLVHSRRAGVDGGHHRQAPRRTRRTEPVEDRSGRAVQGQGVRLGHRQ